MSYIVFLFACSKYYKTRLDFPEKKKIKIRAQGIALEHFSCADQPALENFKVSGHKTF